MVLGTTTLFMEEAGREGEGMVFKDRDEGVMPAMVMFTCTRKIWIGWRDSLNKPWAEDQQQNKILPWQQRLVRFF